MNFHTLALLTSALVLRDVTAKPVQPRTPTKLVPARSTSSGDYITLHATKTIPNGRTATGTASGGKATTLTRDGYLFQGFAGIAPHPMIKVPKTATGVGKRAAPRTTARPASRDVNTVTPTSTLPGAMTSTVTVAIGEVLTVTLATYLYKDLHTPVPDANVLHVPKTVTNMDKWWSEVHRRPRAGIHPHLPRALAVDEDEDAPVLPRNDKAAHPKPPSSDSHPTTPAQSWTRDWTELLPTKTLTHAVTTTLIPKKGPKHTATLNAYEYPQFPSTLVGSPSIMVPKVGDVAKYISENYGGLILSAAPKAKLRARATLGDEADYVTVPAAASASTPAANVATATAA